jgi:AbiU2
MSGNNMSLQNACLVKVCGLLDASPKVISFPGLFKLIKSLPDFRKTAENLEKLLEEHVATTKIIRSVRNKQLAHFDTDLFNDNGLIKGLTHDKVSGLIESLVRFIESHCCEQNLRVLSNHYFAGDQFKILMKIVSDWSSQKTDFKAV